jgi:hypothetical protein
MNKEEAIEVLEEELASLRDESYDELVRRISAGSLDFERIGPSGVTYQVEIQVLWDDRRGGNVRVMGSIDDGKWRAFVPLNREFIKAPDGSFVGE